MESHPCRTLLSPPAGSWSSCLVAPQCPHCLVPHSHSSGGSCAAASAWRGPVGLVCFGFFFAVGCGILGTALGAVQAGLLRLLNLLFTAGKGEGGELGLCAALLSSPKKVPSPLTPSLGSGSLSSEAGWSFGSLGIRVGFQEKPLNVLL